MRTCMAKGQPWSTHHLDSIRSPHLCITWISYPILFRNKFSYVPLISLGAFQASLYSWYPLTTLHTANVHTILALYMMIK